MEYSRFFSIAGTTVQSREISVFLTIRFMSLTQMKIPMD